LVVGFENRIEAERFLKAFRERLAKFGLELHLQKTQLIEFVQFAARDREQRGERKPETFTFLGFTHHRWKRRSNGAFVEAPVRFCAEAIRVDRPYLVTTCPGP
jgi:hypothetical protein